MDYRSLTAALSPAYDFGDWFRLDDGLTGFSGKPGPRPWVLLHAIAADALRAKLQPRSVTGYEGPIHSAHPQVAPHGPCGVNKDARLPRDRVRSLARRELTPDRYGCREPDLGALRAILSGSRR
jgi:hypothetical protein